MKYMGSKSRIAKDIVPIIQKCIDDNNIESKRHAICHVKRVQYSGELKIKLKTSRTGRYTNIKQTIVS